MVQLVVPFLFILIVFILGLAGLMVSLYHYTHYALRGGNSDPGVICGTFLVFALFATSGVDWSIGAALDCFILSISWWL